ncbi:MAG: hypothetical protein C0392_05830 [Syntrophus sp. (in: bacteria)]|nr:hypothetical protein [Syntrophus sp. (in: bacteria)]
MLKKLISFTCCMFLFVGCASQSVKIISNPPGARLLLDGVYKGDTPIEVTMRNSTFKRPSIQLSKEGYETLTTHAQYKPYVPAIVLNVLFFTPLLLVNSACPENEYTYNLVKSGQLSSTATSSQPSTAPLSSPPSKIDNSPKSKCATSYPRDFALQADCVNPPNWKEIKQKIRTKCAGDYPNDFVKQADCVRTNGEAAGWLELNK